MNKKTLAPILTLGFIAAAKLCYWFKGLGHSRSYGHKAWS